MKKRRVGKNPLEDYVVTKDDIKMPRLMDIINNINEIPGPKVKYDFLRRCWGLVADRDYEINNVVTTYGGIVSSKPIEGDYVAKVASDTHIDGKYGFKLKQKGRWLNESDEYRTMVNVKLGRDCRATQSIEEGNWLFADYGPDYDRSNYTFANEFEVIQPSTSWLEERNKQYY